MKPFTVKLIINNTEIELQLKKIIEQFERFSVVDETTTGNIDLTVFSLDNADEKEFLQIQAYIEANHDAEVFLLSRSSDPQILMKAIRIGAKEFLTCPLDVDMAKEAIIRFMDRQKKKLNKISDNLGKIISVIGSKGGVGATTIAVNLAVTLSMARKDISVALLDMNIIFGEIPMFLDINPKYHWGDIIKNMERLDDFFLSNILASHISGVRVLPSPRYLNNVPNPTPPIVDALLDLMISKYDYIIIDLGQSLNETTLRILQRSEIVQLVAIQSLPCLSNTNRLIKTFIDFGSVSRDKISIVLNRYFKKGMISLNNAEEGIGGKLSWIIPNDYQTTMEAINSGKALYQISPSSKIVESFKGYVKTILPDDGDVLKKKKWKWFWR